MSACCRGWAFEGVHDKTCAVGRAASEAAPEHAGPPAARPEMTESQKATSEAKLDALLQGFAAAKAKATKDTP